MAAFGLQTQKSFREFLENYNVMKKSLESRIGELESNNKNIVNENARHKVELQGLTAVKEQLRQTRHRLAVSILRRVRDTVRGMPDGGLEELFCAWREESLSERTSDLRGEVSRLSRAMEKISATLEMKIMEVNNRISNVHEELSGALDLVGKRFDTRMEEADRLLREVSATTTHQLSDFSTLFDEMQADAESRTERFDQQSKALGDAVELVTNCTSREITFEVDNLAARLATAASTAHRGNDPGNWCRYDQRTDSITLRLELESFRAPWTLKGVPGVGADGITGGIREVLPPSISPAEAQEIMSCLEVVRNRMVKKARWIIHNAREVLLPGHPAVKSQAFSIAGLERLEIEIAAVERREWSQPMINVRLICKGVMSLKIGVKFGTAPQKLLSASLERKHLMQTLKDGDDLPTLIISKEGLYPLLDGGAIDHATNSLVVTVSVLSARLANRQLAPGLSVEEEEQGDSWHCDIPSFVPPNNPGGIMTCVDLPRVRTSNGTVVDSTRWRIYVPKFQIPTRSPAEALLARKGMNKQTASELEDAPGHGLSRVEPCPSSVSPTMSLCCALLSFK